MSHYTSRKFNGIIQSWRYLDNTVVFLRFLTKFWGKDWLILQCFCYFLNLWILPFQGTKGSWITSTKMVHTAPLGIMIVEVRETLGKIIISICSLWIHSIWEFWKYWFSDTWNCFMECAILWNSTSLSSLSCDLTNSCMNAHLLQ